jgi:hypothetical protein
MYPGYTVAAELPCIPENNPIWDEESVQSSIQDSTFIDDSPGIHEDHHRTAIEDLNTPKRCWDSFCRSFRQRKARRQTRTKIVTEDVENGMSPLLNPNAIHERRSLNMLTMEVDWISDEQVQISNQENQRPRTRNGFHPLSALPSSHELFSSAPSANALSPSFAKHRRQEKFHALEIAALDHE